MHPLLESLCVDSADASIYRVSESAWSIVVSGMPRSDALRLVRSAARQGLLAEAIRPSDSATEWRAVILKPLGRDTSAAGDATAPATMPPDLQS